MKPIPLHEFIEEERGQLSVGTDFRSFFYVTNDRQRYLKKVA